ncbi:unnamed protein product [Aphanomyces euteiches]|uniref:PX domain-containing protein n=1 Tax=Aphanomyces euteiches TaxID=100861 RepID=A0A6G0W6L9_9STRA|nr:hypothetical protein Ae201684_018105 [Aphanomyces euteiches]KAH9067141.1 hypothetical protein Ae201684P_021308 [Aphanomyces euteiches]
MSFNLHNVSMHVMDYTVDETVVYYKLELVDETTGDCTSVPRRYSAIAAFRQALLKEIEASCECPAQANSCKPFVAALKQCNFPAKTWFAKDGIQSDLVAQRATDLAFFLQDVLSVVREWTPLCPSNQAFLEKSLADILGTSLVIAPRSRKGERSASCELPMSSSQPFQRNRSGSVPMTAKPMIL